MKTKLLIFGITGDLSTRKLLPALQSIVQTGQFDDLQLFGASRRQVDVDELLVRSVGDDTLAERTSVITMDMSVADDYRHLKDELDVQNDEQLLVYMSVPPYAVAQIVENLGEAGLNTPNVKLLFEKPFGVDLASAEDAIDRTMRYFEESQIYRIDHYAAKEVAVALIRLRGDAESHHHHWGAKTVTRVEVLATEAIGIEGRAQFYEQTGALRDFVQGHLMQLLALVLMDPRDNDVPRARKQALDLLQIADSSVAVRAQYEGYQSEVENIGSLVETFAKVQLRSTDPNWQGVPLVLLTGKSLDSKRSQVVIYYTDGSREVFNEDEILPVDNAQKLDAYERVLLDAMSGNKTVFTTSDEVIRSWQILASVQDAWSMDNEPLEMYTKGSRPEVIPGVARP